jgi:hypothetical protein
MTRSTSSQTYLRISSTPSVVVAAARLLAGLQCKTQLPAAEDFLVHHLLSFHLAALRDALAAMNSEKHAIARGGNSVIKLRGSEKTVVARRTRKRHLEGGEIRFV